MSNVSASLNDPAILLLWFLGEQILLEKVITLDTKCDCITIVFGTAQQPVIASLK
jgi:hypothetical protein